METRLFWIGVVMGLYAWLTRRWSRNRTLGSRRSVALWHGLFFAVVGFSVSLIAVLSIESRIQLASSGALDVRQIALSVVGGLLLGAFCFWRAWSTGTKAEKRRYYLNEDQEWAETVFSAVLLAAVLMYFVVQAFKIPSSSMETTLRIGDHLFVNKFVYGVRIPFTDVRLPRFKKVQRGDIIVFRFPTDDKKELHCGSVQYKKDFIKRVIGLPGEKVELKDGVVFVDGRKIDPQYGYRKDEPRYPRPRVPISGELYQKLWTGRMLDDKLGDRMRDNFGPVTVPKDSFLVLGDNRDRSCDSRFWGPVNEKYLKGKAWVRYWPPSRMGRIP